MTTLKWPDCWPTDKRSTIKSHPTCGWVLWHPERVPMTFKDGRWVDVVDEKKVA